MLNIVLIRFSDETNLNTNKNNNDSKCLMISSFYLCSHEVLMKTWMFQLERSQI